VILAKCKKFAYTAWHSRYHMLKAIQILIYFRWQFIIYYENGEWFGL